MAGPIVSTKLGDVRGTLAHGVRQFLGIPYAAAPVGGSRFLAPTAHAPWADVRDATVPGPTPPQRIRQIPGLDVEPLIGSGWVKGNDYLSLNIWAPEDAGTDAPVMVFIHGGAWLIGQKDAPGHNGQAFAQSGVICVAINYRLGIEGFLPIPGCPTNLGLRDQLFALQWVKDNIGAFGGDAENVTVFGESAGAMSIGALVTSPLAKGLFRRAIIQSGHGAMTRSVSVMQRLVVKMAKLLSVPATVAGFQSTTPEQGLDAIEKVSAPTARIDLRDENGREPAFGLSRFLPVHGDDVVPLPPLEALKQGAGREIDILIGTNAEEMNLYFVPTGVKRKLGQLLAWIVLRKSQPQARKVLKAYGLGQGKPPGVALTEAMSDLVFRWPARRFAEEHRGQTHLYELAWRSPLFDGELGACHGVEIPFVFKTLSTATGPKGLVGTAPPKALAESIHAIWVGFAQDGSLPWKPFDRESRQVYELSTAAVHREAPMPAAGFLP